MSSNRELVAQAVAVIPLWRAFLDEKEAEQDALLAEVRNETPPESKPQQLLENSTQAWRKKEAPTEKTEDSPPLSTELPQPTSQVVPQTESPPIESPPIESPQAALPKNPPPHSKTNFSPIPAENDPEFDSEEDFDSDEEEFDNLF